MENSNATITPGSAESPDKRAIVWFDIDNTLYSASSKIADAMGERIHGRSKPVRALSQYLTCVLFLRCIAYFISLGLADDEATELHHKYYRQYGLALRGLVRYHNVGAHDFSAKS